MSLRQASLSCHDRRDTAPLPANQPPKLTVVLATHHHNTLPLPANTPQNLLKTSSHSVQVSNLASSSLKVYLQLPIIFVGIHWFVEQFCQTYGVSRHNSLVYIYI
ncbi:hypothetical protein CICLE_v10013513mg [Citrus x clementina]|uniref:Uncharacterized protein n=1 Tax=Citrus clementina TaxID=85681 RepID=V4SX06_CITCL|nr:hypothetical protein CICLE_v10013513mg [Citrus x clementina]